MAQGRQQNNGSRQRCAQSAAAKAPAEPPKAVCAQLEQMNRKLAAASAEILRYQTRLFACERQMAALRQENAQLEAACEQARQEAECASAHAEQLRQELARHAEAVRPVPVAAHTSPQPEPSAAQSPRKWQGCRYWRQASTMIVRIRRGLRSFRQRTAGPPAITAIRSFHWCLRHATRPGHWRRH